MVIYEILDRVYMKKCKSEHTWTPRVKRREAQEPEFIPTGKPKPFHKKKKREKKNNIKAGMEFLKAGNYISEENTCLRSGVQEIMKKI